MQNLGASGVAKMPIAKLLRENFVAYEGLELKLSGPENLFDRRSSAAPPPHSFLSVSLSHCHQLNTHLSKCKSQIQLSSSYQSQYLHRIESAWVTTAVQNADREFLEGRPVGTAAPYVHILSEPWEYEDRILIAMLLLQVCPQ